MAASEPNLVLPEIIVSCSEGKLSQESIDYLVSLCDDIFTGRLTPGKSRPYAKELLKKMGVELDET